MRSYGGLWTNIHTQPTLHPPISEKRFPSIKKTAEKVGNEDYRRWEMRTTIRRQVPRNPRHPSLSLLIILSTRAVLLLRRQDSAHCCIPQLDGAGPPAGLFLPPAPCPLEWYIGKKETYKSSFQAPKKQTSPTKAV
eukprot:6490812-Amphidinium_carterae.1